MPSKKDLLSQVFLKDVALVASLVEKSSIGRDDTVIEIGPGKGIITETLAKGCKKVIAVEIDPILHAQLIRRFGLNPKIELHNTDFLEFSLPRQPYKVFANVPFAIEGQVARRLFDDPHAPEDTYLIMRAEIGRRFAGVPKESQFSVLHKPWFEASIFRRFNPEDFTPKPKVETVMLRYKKRESPLVEDEFRSVYIRFVELGFGGGQRTLKGNLRHILSYNQFKRAAREGGFSLEDPPSSLSFKQWLLLFRSYLAIIKEKEIYRKGVSRQ